MDEGPADHVRDGAPSAGTRPGRDSAGKSQPAVPAACAGDLPTQRWMVTLATVAFTVSVAATFVTLALATSGKRLSLIHI